MYVSAPTWQVLELSWAIKEIMYVSAPTCQVYGPIRFAEKPWLKVLFADLLWEKNIICSLKIVRLIIPANRAYVLNMHFTLFFLKKKEWTKTPIIHLSSRKMMAPPSLLVIYTSPGNVSVSPQIVTGSIKVWSSVLHSSYSSFDSEGWRENSKETIWVVCMNLEGNMQIIKSFGLHLYSKKKRRMPKYPVSSIFKHVHFNSTTLISS